MMKPTLASLIVSAAWVAWSAPVAAQDNTVRAGIYIIRYHSSADDISGAFAPSGLNLDLKNVNTVYFAYIRRLSAHLDLELAGGYPPKTETVARGPATVGSVPYDGQIIATAKWFSPTLLLNYKFLDEASPVRPYAGIGINCTHFYDRTSTAAGNAVSGGPRRSRSRTPSDPQPRSGCFIGCRKTGAWMRRSRGRRSRANSKRTRPVRSAAPPSTSSLRRGDLGGLFLLRAVSLGATPGGRSTTRFLVRR